MTTDPRAPAPRAPAETAREYLARISEPGRLDASTRTLEQECYGRTPPTASEADAALRDFDAMLRR
ncbi:MAG: DUF4129 domain-containing protein [Frankiaceae bacterium]|nr:DUF4129 domain-containing protein [Frankiaceae bacterium]